jgi:hypothetical protein
MGSLESMLARFVRTPILSYLACESSPSHCLSRTIAHILQSQADVFVYHHLGLGDMIHCNGMVRWFAEELKQGCNVHVFCKSRNAAMTRWMYRDNPRILVEPLNENRKESQEVQRILRSQGSTNLIRIGHRPLRQLERTRRDLFFDQLFYLQAGIPYEYRFSKCHWERDFDEEERVFEKLAPAGPYVFLHDDPSRGYSVDTAGIELPIVRNDASESIFHLGLLLERASQVHCMESSLRCMMESLDMDGVQLFYHNFRYPDRPLGTATRLNWIEVAYARAA